MRDWQTFNPLTIKVPKQPFWKAKVINNRTYLDYFYRLEEIAINMFEWKNLPDTVDERFLELTLCEYGMGVYFNEEDIGNVFLTVAVGGPLNMYRIPKYRRAYAVNGFQRPLSDADSVLVFNNYLHQPTILTIMMFARRLYEIERTIEVNVIAQKTPTVIVCDENERLSMENFIKRRNENELVIIGSKNLDLKNINVLNTSAPYVAGDLYTLKRQTWNEALTFLGVSNANTEKKERLVTDEITSNLGGVEAQRYTMLNSRRQAAKQINKMFGTNIEVNFRQELNMINFDMPTTTDEDIKDMEGNNNGDLYTGN